MLWKLFLFPYDRGFDITLLELTNQVVLLNKLSCGLKPKIDFKQLSLEETRVWENASLRSSSLEKTQQ